MAAQVLAFCNEKGGVGKTCLSVQVSLELASRESKVLFIDLDYSSDATKYFCNRSEDLFSEVSDGDSELGIADVYRLFLDDSDFTPVQVENNLDLLGSTHELMKIQKEDLEAVYNFRDSIEILKPAYDFILIDCPPSIGLLITSALMSTTNGGVVIPSNAELYSHSAALRLVERVKKIAKQTEKDISVLGIVHNRIKNPPTTGMKHFINEMKDTHAGLVMNTSVNMSNRIIDSGSLGESVSVAASSKADKAAANQIKALTDELVERLEETCE